MRNPFRERLRTAGVLLSTQYVPMAFLVIPDPSGNRAQRRAAARLRHPSSGPGTTKTP